MNHPSTFNDIPPVAMRARKHLPEVNIAEAPIIHSLQQMGAEFQLPFPPGRPLPPRQSSLLSNQVPYRFAPSLGARLAEILRRLQITKDSLVERLDRREVLDPLCEVLLGRPPRPFSEP